MVEQILLGKNGVIEGARKGMTVVDASTISPSASCRIGEAFAAAGVDFLGAPVTGSTPGAINGTLTFMVGGDEKVYNAVLPLLEVMGKKLYYCGGPGMGLHAKLTQNLVLSNILQAFNEGIVLSTKAGVPPALMESSTIKMSSPVTLISATAIHQRRRSKSPLQPSRYRPYSASSAPTANIGHTQLAMSAWRAVMCASRATTPAVTYQK